MPRALESEPSKNISPTVAPTKKVSGSGKPSMALVNFWLDAALFVNLIFIMWVSAVLQLAFPPATSAGGCILWRLSFNEWQQVQFGSLCVFSLLALEHVVLHWNWVCNVIAIRVLRLKKRPDEGVQAVYGVGTFIAILLLVLGTLIAAMVTARQVPN